MVSSQQEPDWASQLVDTFESFVDVVRSKTSEPATKIVKYAIFAVMASGLLFFTFILLTIGLVRMVDNYLPQGVWLSYFLLSGLFAATGLLFWRKRRI